MAKEASCVTSQKAFQVENSLSVKAEEKSAVLGDELGEVGRGHYEELGFSSKCSKKSQEVFKHVNKMIRYIFLKSYCNIQEVIKHIVLKDIQKKGKS